MDVLIKNIEIPRKAPSRIYLFPNGTVNLNGEDIDAKAIELPPHGRLVDGDKLLADHNPNENWDYMVLECIIRNAPTVLEASNGSDN